MKIGTKLFIGGIVAMGLLVGLVLLVAEEQHACPNHSKSHIISPITVAHANTTLHDYDVQCAPDDDPPVSEKKLDEPGEFYAITFTQTFKVVNRTQSYMKFEMRCDIIQGPSREAEEEGHGITELVVDPDSIAVFPKVQIKWPRAFKTDDLKKFHYICGCSTKVVRRPLKVFLMPFVPDNR